MSGSGNLPGTETSFLGEAEERRLLDLLAYLEHKIPAAYRREILSYLLPRAVPLRDDEAPFAAPEPDTSQEIPPPAAEAAHQEVDRVALEPYLALFARRGETLLKALATLRFAETHLAVRWLTPTEIARLFHDIGAPRKLYRSNLSNLLRVERAWVSRRPRGRGFEYGLTAPGRARVDRELRLLVIEPLSEDN